MKIKTKHNLTKWEIGFIRESIMREYEIHDIDNWESEIEFDNYSKKLDRLAKKFNIKFT